MQDELDQFKKNNILKLVQVPKDNTIVREKWVLKNKLEQYGKVVRNSARLVAKCFTQHEGISYT